MAIPFETVWPLFTLNEAALSYGGTSLLVAPGKLQPPDSASNKVFLLPRNMSIPSPFDTTDVFIDKFSYILSIELTRSTPSPMKISLGA